MVIGLDAKRKDAAAWDCAMLSQLAESEKIEDLLQDIEDMDTTRNNGNLCGAFLIPGGARSSLAPLTRPPLLNPTVSLDAVLELVFSRYFEFKSEVHDQLREAFLVFDEDRNGLELPEFKVLLTDLCQRAAAEERSVSKLWKQVVALGNQDEDEGIFISYDLFPAVCFQMGVLPFVPGPGAERDGSESGE